MLNVTSFDIKKYLSEPGQWRVFNGYDEEIVALFCNEKALLSDFNLKKEYVLTAIRRYKNDEGLIEHDTETYNVDGDYSTEPEAMDTDYKNRSLKYMIRVEAAKPEPLPVFDHSLNFYNVYYNVKNKKVKCSMPHNTIANAQGSIMLADDENIHLATITLESHPQILEAMRAHGLLKSQKEQ